jgi:dsDNA-binding SOS-regulon protein
MDRRTFILAQVSAELLTNKVLMHSGNKKIKPLSKKELVDKYDKMYDDIEDLVYKLDEDILEDIEGN